VALLLSLLLLPPTRGSPVQRPNGVGEGYSYARLPAPARRAKRAILRWLSLKAAASRASTLACTSSRPGSVAVERRST